MSGTEKSTYKQLQKNILRAIFARRSSTGEKIHNILLIVVLNTHQLLKVHRRKKLHEQINNRLSVSQYAVDACVHFTNIIIIIALAMLVISLLNQREEKQVVNSVIVHNNIYHCSAKVYNSTVIACFVLI